MSESARSRYTLDLDEIERQIREASSRQPAPGQANDDPLAELARIVSGNGRSRAEARMQQTSLQAPAPVPFPTVTPRDLSHVVAREFAAPLPAPEVAPAAPAAGGLEDDIEKLLERREQNAEQRADAYDEFAEAMRSFERVIADPRVAAEAALPVAGNDANAMPAEVPVLAAEPYVQHQADAYAPPAAEPPIDLSRELSELIASAQPAPVHMHEPAPVMGLPEPEPLQSEYSDAMHPEPPVRSRKKSLMLVAAVVGVAAIGVGGALSFRGKGGLQADSGPPLIRAAEGPTKIAPANPGGAQVPDQNRQILERTAQRPNPVQPKVVASEEQPLDLKEAVRKETPAQQPDANGAPRVILSSPMPGPGQPANGSAVEPRRVKTVVIKPPGSETPAAPAPVAAPVAAAPAAAADPIKVAAIPPKQADPAPAAPPAAAQPAQATPAAQAPKPRPKPPVEARRTPQAQPAAAAPAQSNDEPAATGTSPMSIVPTGQPKRNQRLQQQAAIAAPAAAAPVQSDAAPSARSSGGSFVVQLSSEGTDAEARSSASRFKSRYDELGDFGSSIQRREVNGQTRYRVRFGAMSREDANALCSSLKGKGQACIVQPN